MTNKRYGFIGVLAQNFLLCNTFSKKTRSAAQTETAGDSEELLARVVGPTSSSYFLPVAGEVTTDKSHLYYRFFQLRFMNHKV